LPLRLAAHIKWAEVGGIVYILDLAQDRYFGLNREFRNAWLGLLASQSCRDRDNRDAVSATLLDDISSRGWLDELPCRVPRGCDWLWHPLTHVYPRVPSRLLAFRAWLCLAIVAVSFRLWGLGPTYRAAAAVSASPCRSPTPDYPSLVGRFIDAERFFVSSQSTHDCLPRSLALYVFLRRFGGVPARHHIGVCRFPFVAHAWTTVHGRPLLDREGMVDAFVTLAELPDDAHLVRTLD